MPHYLFRRDICEPASVRDRPLMDNLSRALLEVIRQAPNLTYDLASAIEGKDAAGERVEITVGTLADVGWHLRYNQILEKHGVAVTRFKTR